jgi:hypothetical protein
MTVMLRTLFRLLRLAGDARAARRGPAVYGQRRVRRAAHRTLARWLRRM